jgi:crotonobetainyl-CoA:carnitine CoA-transferase CaiB-like acyl-CoA transferase
VNDRINCVDELEQEIEKVFLEQPAEIWLKKLEDAGIPCGPIYTYDQVLQDEQILHREMIMDYEDPIAGPMKTLGFPAKMSITPAQFHFGAPSLGQHNETILKQLNFTEEEIDHFKNESII